MDGPRFFRLAVRLPFYEGAVRAAMLAAMHKEGGHDATSQARSAESVGAPVVVNVPGRGPSYLPAGANYTASDRGSLMASPVFRDVIEFGGDA